MKSINQNKFNIINIYGRFKVVLILSLLVCFFNSSFAQSPMPGVGQDKDWNFVVAPYLWFGGLGGTLGAATIEAEMDASFSDIFSNLNMGFMIYGEARYKKFGVAIDWIALSMKLDGMTPVLDRAVKVEPRISFLETSIIYNLVNSEKWTSDLHVGVRSWWIDYRMEAERIISEESQVVEGDKSWVDPIIGAKAVYLPHEKWPINARFDIGGFGAGSEFSWNIQVGAGYRFAKAWTASLQYRALGVDYTEGTSGSMDYFKMDATLHGPLIGIMATF
jgi:hypothetical protein